MRTFQIWEESRVPGKNRASIGRAGTPQTVASAGNQLFFLISINERVLSKMTLFNDLMYFKIAIINMFKDLKENNSKGKMETIKKESNENSRAEKYNT